mmetsp:Transcript_17788/g.24628  ORF Transcript_17788/g.24628 Transcript_17788/m.24628 type:complete len:215 (-) Transcript_17788:26-670(-)
MVLWFQDSFHIFNVLELLVFVNLIILEEWPSIAKSLEFRSSIVFEQVSNLSRMVHGSKYGHVQFNLHSITFNIFLRQFNVVHIQLSKQETISEVQTSDTKIVFLISQPSKELFIRPVCLELSFVKREIILFFSKLIIPFKYVVLTQTIFIEVIINLLFNTSIQASAEHVNFITFTIISNVTSNLIEPRLVMISITSHKYLECFNLTDSGHGSAD